MPPAAQQRPKRDRIQVECCIDALHGRAYNETSQFGEDGLIEAALELTGVENRWCFEIGAADGVYLSNTWRLRQQGWRCVLIEANHAHADALSLHADDAVTCVIARVPHDGLSAILDEHGCPRDCDLGVIDVDGQDWHFLRYLEHRPRVLMVEVALADFGVPECGGPGQAGLTAIRELAESMGYVFVAKTRCNALFIRRAEA